MARVPQATKTLAGAVGALVAATLAWSIVGEIERSGSAAGISKREIESAGRQGCLVAELARSGRLTAPFVETETTLLDETIRSASDDVVSSGEFVPGTRRCKPPAEVSL